MNEVPDVVIVMSRCSHSKDSFGIRFEKDDRSNWIADWAFPAKEVLGHKEGYDKNEIKGSITLDTQYPGCPHCRNKSFVLCSTCTKVSCYDSTSNWVVCPWCNVGNSVGGSIQALRGGGDY